MKKVFLIALSAFAMVGMTSAQSDCMDFFPTTKGATMTNKSYDANNNLINTTTYTVADIDQYYYGGDATIAFTSTDLSGKVVDQGSLEARCNDGNFYLKSFNRSAIPECQNMVFENIEIMANFLDYPNTFASPYPYDNTFEMDGAEFTVKDKTNNGEYVRVRVYNRDLGRNEKIETPAGKFDAAKITYMVEVYDSKTDSRKDYKGVEWYALGSGIVRSEIYDDNNNLQTYSVLTAMTGNDD